MATKPGKEVATVAQAGLPAVDPELLALMGEQAGKGVSTDQADNLVPLIYILQAQSPQALKRNPGYIEGAEAGSIWLRNAPGPIVSGEDGIEVLPVHFTKDVVEWKQRDSGGGFVARHEFGTGEDIRKLAARLGAEERVDAKNPNRIMYIMPQTGNELIETRYHTVLVVREGDTLVPFVIPLSGTGHSFSRRWMFKMNTKQLPGGKGVQAAYNNVYRLKTVPMSNAAGDWFAYQEDDGVSILNRFGKDIKDPAEKLAFFKGLLAKCNDLHDAFARGVKQADLPESDVSGDTVDASAHI